MRTKALMLAAALCVAGAVTAAAQAVYSVNAVGYINLTIPTGFSIIACQLNNMGEGGNDVRALMANLPATWAGVTLYKFNGAGYDILTYDDLDEDWVPSTLDMTLNPGEAAFIRNGTGTELTATFVGEVPQGELTVNLPQGFSMASSMVPQEAALPDLGLVGAAGDTIYLFDNENGGYQITTYDDLDEAWLPFTPSVFVGQGFWYRKIGAAGAWTRTFDINNP